MTVVVPLDKPAHMIWASPDEAASFAEHYGWAVFPVRANKHPMVPKREDWRVLSSEDPWYVRMTWPSTGAGIGIDCGKSGIVVIDHDRPAADWPWFDDVMVRWSSVKRMPHEIYLNDPDDPVRCPPLDFGEVKGLGGYVVASDLGDNHMPITRIPQVIKDAIERHRVTVTTGTASAGPVVRRRGIGSVADRLRELEPGSCSADQSRSFIDQILGRFSRVESAGNRHNPMRSAVEQAVIEGMVGELRMADAYDRLGDVWDELKPGERQEYENFWVGELDRLDGNDPELLRRVAAKRADREELDPTLAEWVEKMMREAEGVVEAVDDSRATAVAVVDGAEPPPEVKPETARGSSDAPDLWLPPEFWDLRPMLGVIRDSAEALLGSPDTLLDVILARVGAILPHRVKISGEFGKATAHGLYVTPLGESGKTKSTLMSLAAQMVPAPSWVVDDIHPGSGEGITEALFGEVDPVPPATKPLRVQRWENGIVQYSEGTKLFEQEGRSGSTLTSVLRGAFSNDTIGEDLADRRRSRKLQGDAYVLSMVMGFQPGTVRALFSEGEVAAGTPQRFLFSMAQPRVLVRWPDRRHWPAGGDPLWEPVPLPAGRPFGLSVELCERVRVDVNALREASAPFGSPSDVFNSHEPLVKLKLAGCLALLLDRRFAVSEDVWEMAQAVYDRSRRVREWAQREMAADRARAAAAVRDAHVRTAVSSTVAADMARERKALESWVRAAVRIVDEHARSGHHDDGGCRTTCLKVSVNSQTRGLAGGWGRLLDELVRRELVDRSGDGRATRWFPRA